MFASRGFDPTEDYALENYRKFQLALARDVMEQQEVEVLHSSSPDPLRQTLQSVQSNRQEEIRATIQALNLRQLRKAMSVLRSAEIIEIEATDNSLPVAMDASLKLGGLGKRCMTSAVAAKASRPPASRMRITSLTCWWPTVTPRCCCSPAKARCTG